MSPQPPTAPPFQMQPGCHPEKPSSVNRVPLGGLDWTDHLCVSRTQQGAHCLCQELFNKGLVGRCRFFPLCGIEIGGWSGQQFGGNEVFIVQVLSEQMLLQLLLY